MSEPLGLLFLAMTYWQLGDPDRAKDCFYQAAGHPKKPGNPREARIRDEVRRLLEL